MIALTQVFDSETSAEKATVKGDLVKAKAHHQATVEIIDKIFEELSLEGKSQEQDEYDVMRSIQTLKSQILKRIENLGLLIKNKEERERQMANNKQLEEAKLRQLSSMTLDEFKTEDQSLDQERIIQILFNKINVLLIKNLNIDTNNAQIKSKNLKFIEHKRIVELQHSLQILNFSEKDKDNERREKEKNELLKELNLLYYNQIAAQSEFIRELIDLMRQPYSSKNIEEKDKQQSENPKEELKMELENYKGVVNDLQLKLSSSEREKILLENQIVKLKERWNNLVESARLRKEQERVSSNTISS